MQAAGADFTLTFRRLADDAGAGALPGAGLEAWLPQWRARLARDPQGPAERGAAMRAVNPAVIPRNHRVEAALAAAVYEGDFGPFERLHAILASPYEVPPDAAAFMAPPAAVDPAYRTFCGT